MRTAALIGIQTLVLLSTLVLLGREVAANRLALSAHHDQMEAHAAALKTLCGPLVITTYERGETVITGPDGEVIE